MKKYILISILLLSCFNFYGQYRKSLRYLWKTRPNQNFYIGPAPGYKGVFGVDASMSMRLDIISIHKQNFKLGVLWEPGAGLNGAGLVAMVNNQAYGQITLGHLSYGYGHSIHKFWSKKKNHWWKGWNTHRVGWMFFTEDGYQEVFSSIQLGDNGNLNALTFKLGVAMYFNKPSKRRF